MAAKPKSRFWRVTRRVFRWCRIAVWLLLLAAILGAVWLNRVGVPDILKERLVAELRVRGITLQFTRMRLHWYRGIIAENVRVGKPADTNAPQFSATEAELLVNGRALLDRKFQLSGMSLRGGRMIMPVWGTNDVPRELTVEKISGELRFTPPDEWDLANLHAEAFGVKLLIAGTVTNASSFQNLRFGRKPREPKSAQAFWYELVQKLEASRFDAPSEIIGRVTGDANDPASFRATLNVSSPRVNSPWGQGDRVLASVLLAPAKSGAFEADVKLQAHNARMQWGQAGSLVLDAHVAPSFTRWTPTNAHVSLAMKQARTRWASAGNLTLVANFTPSSVSEHASMAHYVLRAQQVDSRWAKAAQLELESEAVLTSSNLWPSTARAKLQFSGGEAAPVRASGGNIEASLELPPLAELEFANTNLSWRTRLDRVRAGLNVTARDVRSPRLDLDQLAFAANWTAPLLTLRDVRSSLYDGTVEGTASLNTVTRELKAAARTTVDPHRVKSLLDTNSQKWLAQFTWQKPPLLSASAQVTLPVWTNGITHFSRADWNGEVLPSLSLAGELSVGDATYRALPVSSVKSSFNFSNLVWRLPDLLVTRPEGRAVIAHVGHSRTHEFMFDVDSTVDPKAITPLLTRAERALLDEFFFTNAPHLRLQMAGNYREPEKISFRAELAATNLSFRALPVREARTTLTMTNQVLVFSKPVVVREEGTGRADAVSVDLVKLTVVIDNALGTLDPSDVTHAVGPEVEELMRPYHFVGGTYGHVYGLIDCKSVKGTDMHFELAGGPFEWMNFRFQQITGHVHWLGESVTLSNVIGSLHGGRLEGSTRFDFGKETKFSFRTLFNDINLHSLVSDLGSKSNRVEGTLNGLLVVTNAVAEDMKSWHGYGNLAVNDGLLWEFPIFGLFSPMLNAVKEGAGNNKAREARATFIMTNSVIYSRDLVIHASGNMRMRGEGTVDFDTRVNGRMTAQIFRDTPGIGTLMSTVLWPVAEVFKYKVTGTLAKPEAAPVYIPAFLTHPLKTLKGLGGESDQ